MSEKSIPKITRENWLKRIKGIVLDNDNEVQIIPNDNECEIAEFVPLNVDKDYEILNIPPHTIRRKDNHKEVRSTLITHCCSCSTQLVISLNGKLYLENEIRKYYDNLRNGIYD